MPSPFVYVVVLNWNLKTDTAAAVESLLCSDYENFRVLVIDNGSSDGSSEYLRATFPSLDVIQLRENVGYAAGNNVGIKYALDRGADYLLLLNNDTVVDHTFLTELISVAATERQLGVLSPVIYYFDQPDTMWQCGAKDRRFPPLPLDLTLRDVRTNESLTKGFCEVDYVTGCAMLIRSDVLRDVGLLNEDYFMYYEDSDFCLRARRKGYKIGVVLNARIWHKVATSTKRILPFQRRVRAKSRVMFYRRYTSGWNSVLLVPFLFASIMRTLFIDSLHARMDLVKSHVLGLYEGLTA